jgi:hypothetical protein
VRISTAFSADLAGSVTAWVRNAASAPPVLVDAGAPAS